jgi:hypothetical protein
MKVEEDEILNKALVTDEEINILIQNIKKNNDKM